jgi:hypothetical protein
MKKGGEGGKNLRISSIPGITESPPAIPAVITKAK